jgi:hypothetical protein
MLGKIFANEGVVHVLISHLNDYVKSNLPCVEHL